jgi:uncharacterized protein (DUF305 family)
MIKNGIPAFALVLAAGALSACASGGSGVAAGAAGGTAGVPAEATSPSTGSRDELEALFRQRQQAARMRFTEADVHFMTGMIAHHGQAILMARMAAEREVSPQLRVLAARIQAAQAGEIELMQQWLRERGRPVPELHYTATSVMMHVDGAHAGHHHAMRGMLTDVQLQELAARRGREFDRLFLVHMIEHHRGAVVMVDELMASDGAAQDPTVFRLAADIKVEQVSEIGRMQQMLAQHFQPRTN